MLNPQMGIPSVPPVKELWKNEKSKYRHWILLFGIGILIVFALQLTSFILNMTSVNQIKNALSKAEQEAYPNLSQTQIQTSVNYIFTRTFMIFPIIQFSFVGLGILYFITTVYHSYKKHSFARISQWATMVIGIGAFIAIYQLLNMAWSSSSRIVINESFRGGIFQFINYFLVIGVYFGTSVKVSRIRREFAISERVEKLKNDPMFQQQMEAYKNMMQNGGMQMGPMGPIVNPQTATKTNNNSNTGNASTSQVDKPKISKEEKDLNNMTIVQLREVAKKLLISGFEKMKKPEIIKAILRVTSK